MKKVYLDNNILVEIENGKMKLSDFLSISNVCYYYSPSHIEELIEGEYLEKMSVAKRLEVLETISKNHCIEDSYNTPTFTNSNPRQLYKKEKLPYICQIRTLLNNKISNLNVDKNVFVSFLDIKEKEINNIPPNLIFSVINEKLIKSSVGDKQQYIPINIQMFLKLNDAIGRAKFVTLFNLLDFSCWHKDKVNIHSNIARLHDASHAYYAQICDYFVSEDKKMIYKTKAVYSYLGINTQVMRVSAFKELINTKYTKK